MIAALRQWARRHNILRVTKDGGPESAVWAHWLFEFKGLGSIVLLRFEDGSRDAYHSHAFDCISWVLSGELNEIHHHSTEPDPFRRLDIHWPSIFPVITLRSTTHMVRSRGRTWVLSFRGPWADTWQEILPGDRSVALASGRVEVAK
jgi:hypothetical protein